MSKRGHGEGTIFQLKSGNWRWQCMEGRKLDGKPRWVRLSAPTKKELLLEIERYKAAKRSGAIKTIPGFCEFSDMWFNRHKEHIRASSHEGYSYTLKKLQTYWANTSIDEISASSIYDMLMYHDKEIGLSGSYIKKLRSMAFQILEAAEADNLVLKNPARYVKYKLDEKSPHKKKASLKKDAFTDDEINLVIAGEDQGKWHEAFLLLLGSGLRVQELLALRGNNIDVSGMYIEVHDAVNMTHGRAEIGPTKSVHSTRTIPIPSTLQYIAKKWRYYDDHLIFESPKKHGKPVNPNTFRKGFKAFCKRTGIRALTPHCTRHTYVTKLRENNVDQEIVKALVGHSRTDVTEGYNHISQKTLTRSVEKISYLFEGCREIEFSA